MPLGRTECAIQPAPTAFENHEDIDIMHERGDVMTKLIHNTAEDNIRKGLLKKD